MNIKQRVKYIWKKYKYEIMLALILFFAFFARIYQIAEPFVGHHDFVNAQYAIYGQNYLRYGFETNLIPVENIAPVTTPKEFKYYPTHLIFTGIFTAISFLIFGVHEWSVRFVSVLFSLISIVIIYLLAKELWNKKIALLSGSVLAFMRICVFFGRITTSDIIVVTFTLMCYYFYILWQKYNNNKYFGAMILTFVIGGLTDWHIYFIIPVIALHCFFKSSKTSNTQKRNKMILFLIIVLLIPILFFALVYFTMGKIVFEYMFHSLIRTSGVFLYGMKEPTTFSIFSLASLELQRAYFLFTPILCFLFAIWTITTVISFSKKKYSTSNDIIIIMLISGLLDIFIFKEIAYSHDFLLLPFSFSFAMASALGFEQLIKKMLFLFSKHNYFTQKTKILACVFFILISSSFILLALNQIGNMHSKDDLRDYQTGLFLNKNTLTNQVIIADHETKAINYYSKRNTLCRIDNIIALDNALKNNPEKYPYFVISPDSPFTNCSFKQHLFSHYKLYDFNNVLMFELTQNPDKNIFNKTYTPEQKRKINFNDKIEFTGYDITYQPENKSPIKRYILGNADRYITITLYWKITGYLNKTYFSFVNFKGESSSFEEGNALFYNLYPSSKWKINETIKETYLVEIPTDAKHENYSIIIGIHDEDSKKLKIKENKEKNSYFAYIGNIYII